MLPYDPHQQIEAVVLLYDIFLLHMDSVYGIYILMEDYMHLAHLLQE